MPNSGQHSSMIRHNWNICCHSLKIWNFLIHPDYSIFIRKKNIVAANVSNWLRFIHKMFCDKIWKKCCTMCALPCTDCSAFSNKTIQRQMEKTVIRDECHINGCHTLDFIVPFFSNFQRQHTILYASFFVSQIIYSLNGGNIIKSNCVFA